MWWQVEAGNCVETWVDLPSRYWLKKSRSTTFWRNDGMLAAQGYEGYDEQQASIGEQLSAARRTHELAVSRNSYPSSSKHGIG